MNKLCKDNITLLEGGFQSILEFFQTKITIIFLKGFAMGSADVVPGVSGGTIAFITGIYDELISTLGNINLSLLKLILRGDLKGFWIKANLQFLFVILEYLLGISDF